MLCFYFLDIPEDPIWTAREIDLQHSLGIWQQCTWSCCSSRWTQRFWLTPWQRWGSRISCWRETGCGGRGRRSPDIRHLRHQRRVRGNDDVVGGGRQQEEHQSVAHDGGEAWALARAFRTGISSNNQRASIKRLQQVRFAAAMTEGAGGEQADAARAGRIGEVWTLARTARQPDTPGGRSKRTTTLASALEAPKSWCEEACSNRLIKWSQWINGEDQPAMWPNDVASFGSRNWL